MPRSKSIPKDTQKKKFYKWMDIWTCGIVVSNDFVRMVDEHFGAGYISFKYLPSSQYLGMNCDNRLTYDPKKRLITIPGSGAYFQAINQHEIIALIARIYFIENGFDLTEPAHGPVYLSLVVELTSKHTKISHDKIIKHMRRYGLRVPNDYEKQLDKNVLYIRQLEDALELGDIEYGKLIAPVQDRLIHAYNKDTDLVKKKECINQLRKL